MATHRAAAVVLLATILQAESLGNELSPKANAVVIRPNAVLVPTGTILLARKGQEYCAVKIISSKQDPKQGEWTADYEAYYQHDSSGSFTNANAKYRKGRLVQRDVTGLGHLTATNRSRETILCGEGTKADEGIALQWSGQGWIYPYVYYDRDKSRIMLAPTKWKDIGEVNYLDSRLNWYGYDEKRSTVEVAIDKLW